ncbi:hypothetical protein QVD17_23709 [Tagetes erecta]|uniref:Uncharacterized protein n=1 Tax=Tagetes erecta TaxID=13708 RepID=A0AAD8KHD8_TARER|nr:hypothetical protein QVD17_23709 [Tagetes erecta]
MTILKLTVCGVGPWYSLMVVVVVVVESGKRLQEGKIGSSIGMGLFFIGTLLEPLTLAVQLLVLDNDPKPPNPYTILTARRLSTTRFNAIVKSFGANVFELNQKAHSGFNSDNKGHWVVMVYGSLGISVVQERAVQMMLGALECAAHINSVIATVLLHRHIKSDDIAEVFKVLYLLQPNDLAWIYNMLMMFPLLSLQFCAAAWVAIDPPIVSLGHILKARVFNQ